MCFIQPRSVRVRVCVRYGAEVPITSAKGNSPVSRDDVARAAVRLVEQQGMDALSVRAVARAVGLSPMSLYTHVRDRGDLADLVVDARIAELVPNLRLPKTWDAALHAISRWWFDVFVEHEEILTSVLRRPHYSRPAMGLVNDMLARLQKAGWSADESVQIYLDLFGLVCGIAAVSVYRSPADRGGGVWLVEDGADLEHLMAARSTVATIGSVEHLESSLSHVISAYRALKEAQQA